MKVIAAIFALVAVANAGLIPATTLIRSPKHDSAVIQSDRLGGNFAYSSVEAHAYESISPVVQNVVSPVGVSYSATPIATPINLLHQQYIPSQLQLIPQVQYVPQVITPGQVVAPFIPGVVAPSFTFENLNPATEKPAEEAVATPEPAPASEPAPAEPQSDAVSVEAV